MKTVEVRRVLTPGQYCLAQGRHVNRNSVTVPICPRMAKLEVNLTPCCPACAKARRRKLAAKAAR